MIYGILASISLLAASVIETLGYGGIFFLMAAESSGIPIPSEIIMPFSGFVASRGAFALWGAVCAGVFGNIVGSLIFYWIGLRWGRPFIDRFGKYFMIHRRDMDLAERWFARWGVWAAFFGRMLPAIRTYISFPAGVARMNLGKFIVFSSIGIIPWVWFLAWLGARLGSEWQTLERYFRKFDYAVALVVAAGVFWWVRRHLHHRHIDAQQAVSHKNS